MPHDENIQSIPNETTQLIKIGSTATNQPDCNTNDLTKDCGHAILGSFGGMCIGVIAGSASVYVIGGLSGMGLGYIARPTFRFFKPNANQIAPTLASISVSAPVPATIAITPQITP